MCVEHRLQNEYCDKKYNMQLLKMSNDINLLEYLNETMLNSFIAIAIC